MAPALRVMAAPALVPYPVDIDARPFHVSPTFIRAAMERASVRHNLTSAVPKSGELCALGKSLPFSSVIIITGEGRRVRADRARRALCLQNSELLHGDPAPTSLENVTGGALGRIDLTKLSLGEVGIHLAHRKALFRCLQTGSESCLILEDDFTASGPRLVERWVQASRVLSPGWEMLFLGNCLDYDCQSSTRVDHGADLYRVPRHNLSGFTDRSAPKCLHAYAVTRAGAQAMIDAVDECPGYCPVDWMPSVLAARGLPSNTSSSTLFTVSPALISQAVALRLQHDTRALPTDADTGRKGFARSSGNSFRRAFVSECVDGGRTLPFAGFRGRRSAADASLVPLARRAAESLSTALEAARLGYDAAVARSATAATFTTTQNARQATAATGASPIVSTLSASSPGVNPVHASDATFTLNDLNACDKHNPKLPDPSDSRSVRLFFEEASNGWQPSPLSLGASVYGCALQQKAIQWQQHGDPHPLQPPQQHGDPHPLQQPHQHPLQHPSQLQPAPEMQDAAGGAKTAPRSANVSGCAKLSVQRTNRHWGLHPISSHGEASHPIKSLSCSTQVAAALVQARREPFSCPLRSPNGPSPELMSVQLSQLHGFLTSAAGYLSSDADDATPCEVQSPLSVILWSALEGRSSEDLSPII
jgi:GR25 family glycosyltransferase involved in LPS biosynthesis